jgi:hypothetical protein
MADELDALHTRRGILQAACSNRRNSAIPPTVASWRRSISLRLRKPAVPSELKE